MAYRDFDQETIDLIERVCTDRQVEVVKLWASGVSWRNIGDILDIDVSTARGHFRAAMRKLRKQPEIEKARAA